jgi:integrase/recombinase XerC
MTLTTLNHFTAIANSVESDLITNWLQSKRSITTRTTYKAHLKQFFNFSTGEAPNPTTLGQFLSLVKYQAVTVVTSYLCHLRDVLNRAPSTINVALSAIKSLVNYAALVGKCNYSLSEIKSEKTITYRDTSGVDVPSIKRLLKANDTDTLVGLRNQVILTLFWELGLRRCEVIRLDISDIDLKNKRLSIRGKGRNQSEFMTISDKAVNLLSQWLERSGNRDKNEPVFIALDHSSYGKRIGSVTVWKIVKEAGEMANLDKSLSPHKIRHSTITALLDATNGDYRRVQKLSRHKNIQTLTVYDDNRRDDQGALTQLLSEV